MEQFWDDLDSGEFHIRDRWQIELKSDFFPQVSTAESEYIQEFYLFIPHSLQINRHTYTKNQFYLDQTNLIRYKTPEFSFKELLNSENPRSPLTRLNLICNSLDSAENRCILADELKLLGNVVRSALRANVKDLIAKLVLERNEGTLEGFVAHTQQLCLNIKYLRKEYAISQEKYLKNWKKSDFFKNYLYIDEFISHSITHYLTGLLENLRLGVNKRFTSADQALCEILINEKRITEFYVGTRLMHTSKADERRNEQILYRNSLLNKYVLDALLLDTNRFTIEQRYQHWIGSISAGIAMLIYFILFIWLGRVFVINSQPFILFTVTIYILKDRIKEWIKTVSYYHVFKWFSDYSTEIQTANEHYKIGVIKETFSFIEEKKLLPEIYDARNLEFHEVLETFQRPEDVLFYKRIVQIHKLKEREARRHGLNIIFRYNIHRFLRKAGNPAETYYTLDPRSRRLLTMRLPKVYHLDLIIRNIHIVKDGLQLSEIKKLRIIIDKNGIKRIEQIIK